MTVIYIAEAVCALLAIFAIIRWDLREGEFTTGGSQLAAALVVLIVALLRLFGVSIASHGVLLGGAICALLVSIARFYYDRRFFVKRDR